MKPLLLIQKRLSLAIPVVMVLGILYGYFFNPMPLKQLIIPVTLLMVYPMMVTLNFRKLFSKGEGKVLLVSQLINFFIFPTIAYGIGRIFFNGQPYIQIGLLLIALIPTSGMTISWTGFAKGNMSAAVKLTVLGLILGAVLSPFYIEFIMGETVNIPLLSIFKQIIVVVFIPMIFGFATQRLLIKKFGQERFLKEFKPQFPPKSTLGVMGIVFIAMALKSETIISNPLLLLTFIVPVVLYYILMYSVSSIIGRLFFKKEDAIALVYGTVMRNHSIALAIAMAVFSVNGSDMAMIISIAIIIQVQSAAIYVKVSQRLFGKTEKKLVTKTA